MKEVYFTRVGRRRDLPMKAAFFDRDGSIVLLYADRQWRRRTEPGFIRGASELSRQRLQLVDDLIGQSIVEFVLARQF